mgnify:CR=1 FL=1
MYIQYQFDTLKHCAAQYTLYACVNIIVLYKERPWSGLYFNLIGYYCLL